MAEERYGNGAPREIQDIRGERSVCWRETEREMEETARRLQQTLELFISEWDKLMESLARRDLIPLLNNCGIEVDCMSRHYERNYGGRRWDIDMDIDIDTVNGR